MLKRRRAIPAVANNNTTEKTKSCSVTRCLHTLLEELHSQPRAGPCSWIDKALRCVFFWLQNVRRDCCSSNSSETLARLRGRSLRLAMLEDCLLGLSVSSKA